MTLTMKSMKAQMNEMHLNYRDLAVVQSVRCPMLWNKIVEGSVWTSGLMRAKVAVG